MLLARRARCVLFIVLTNLLLIDCGSAQETTIGTSQETAAEKKERVTAERFLQLLKRRPRLGTALDKIYGYHVGQGSLDAFCTSLETDARQTNDGKLWLILGMVQMQRGQDAAAATSLETAEALLPNEPLACYYLGKTLVLLGEVDKAADAIRRAIERKPPRADMLAMFQDLGRIYQRTGRNQEALDVWKQLESLFPGDSQVQEEIASILAEEGASEAALERYTKLGTTLKDRFRRIEMAIRAAQLKAELGDVENALADFEKQLGMINPDSWLHRDVRRRIEEVFWSSGDVDGLVAYYAKWLESHPDDVDAMMRTARVLSVQRRLPEAETWFRRAIKRAPTKTDIRMALVEALVTDDQYAQAAKEMEEVTKIEPDNPDYIIRWGELVFNDTKRTETQRKKEAATIWRGLLRKRGDDAATVARLADLLRETGDSDAAIEQYKNAIELSPTEPQYREYLGEYLHQLDRKDEAMAVWRELASGPRETRDNLVRLSEVLSTFRYANEALETMAKACDMKPTFGHRARYAELLREAKRYDDALAQLELAEPLAEDPELREIVVDERIKNYQASGTLGTRIEEAELAVAGDGANDADNWRLLALLRDADRKFQPACEAIQKATELDPGNAVMWETAAMLQERSGQFGDAVSSFRRLATIDRRFLSNYLTQIAALEMRLGNTESALKAGEELIASAPGNSEHYRFFADLCFRVGQSDRGFDVLRRNVRSNPNDEDALLYLAKVLSDEFKTDEAIELYWRGFDLAKDIDGKNAIIAPLTELYLRTNRFDTLIDRLEMTGREQNKPREGLLWAAAAHQAAGDLGMAKQLLEQLARADSRDTKLLEQLVGLSRSEYDFESAAEYQKRLVAASPSPENEYQLANILLELGEIDQAESLWLKLSQRKNDPSALVSSLNTLLQKEEFDTAATLIEKTMASQPNNWEVLGYAMIVYVKVDRKEDANRVAQKVEALRVEPAEPTAKVKALMAKRAASGKQNDPRSYNPYQNLGQPSRLLQNVSQIKQTLGAATDRYTRSRIFEPACFQDVQSIAYCIPLVTSGESFDAKEFTRTFAEKAIKSGEKDQLWKAVAYIVWADQNARYGQTVNRHYEECMQALVELDDPVAASSLLGLFVNRRRQKSNNDTSKLEPLNEEEVAKATKWSRVASTANTGLGNYYDLWLANELDRLGKSDEASELVDKYMASAAPSYRAMASLQAMSVMLGQRQEEPPSERSIAKAKQLFTSALEILKATKPGSSNRTGTQIGPLLGRFAKFDHMDDSLQMLGDVLEWQAVQTAGLRPSQRDRLQTSGQPLTSGRVVNGRYVRETITFPPVSGYFGAESILALHGLYLECKEEESRLNQLTEQVNQWANEPEDDPYLRMARLLAKAALAYWAEDRSTTEDALAGAAELQIGSQFLGLARTRLLYESGKVDEALRVVESLRPTNQRMLVDRELTILQLVLQLGDLDRAKRSAQKLFALRLDSETEFKLADLMYQLGMRDMGERMMGRIRRRAGGQQTTLVQLMTRYATANDNDAAAEIARQVIRRTSPSTSRSYRTSENQQHEQAVRILVQTQQIEPLIKQYEKLVERSPKSTKLTDKLAAFYEAAGRRSDAEKLRLRAVKSTPNNPRALFAAGQQLLRLRKNKEAAEKFIAAIRKSPDLLEQNYYEMESAFEAAKTWDQLADAMIDEGIQKFAQSYRMQEVCYQLLRADDNASVNRLIAAALKTVELDQMNYMLYRLDQKFKANDEVAELMTKKLVDDKTTFANLSRNAYIWSRSSNGQTSGTINGVAGIVASDDDMRTRVIEAMKKRIAKDDNDLFARTLLAHTLIAAEDYGGVTSALAALVEKEKKTADDAKALWSVASALTHNAKQPDIACNLLESVTDDSLWEQSSGFRYTAPSLLAYSYEQTGRHADARRLLVDQVLTAKVDEERSRNNPGYGEYNYINSLSSLADRLVKMDYPVEAFIAYRKAFTDDELLEKAKRWGGSPERNRDSIKAKIAEKTSADVILKIVEEATATQRPGAPSNDEQNDRQEVVQFLTDPTIKRDSLVDTRVTMLLEDFTWKIREDDSLKKPIVNWLDEHPLGDSNSHSLKQLVTRLLISDAVHHRSHARDAAMAIVTWVKENAPNVAPPGARENENVPDELLLGMAALTMPEEIQQSDVVAVLNRAATVAEQLGDANLATSLQCQIAKRIASDDPDRAREILQRALDSVLPKGGKS